MGKFHITRHAVNLAVYVKLMEDFVACILIIQL